MCGRLLMPRRGRLCAAVCSTAQRPSLAPHLLGGMEGPGGSRPCSQQKSERAGLSAPEAARPPTVLACAHEVRAFLPQDDADGLTVKGANLRA